MPSWLTRLADFCVTAKPSLPLKPHSMVSNSLATLTCAMFFRKSLLEKRGLFLVPNFQALGDTHWIIRCVEQKVPMALLLRFTSVFTDTGENLSLKPAAQREQKILFDRAPAWIKRLRLPIVLHHRLRKLFADAYRQAPFACSIYTTQSLTARVTFPVEQPIARYSRYVPSPERPVL